MRWKLLDCVIGSNVELSKHSGCQANVEKRKSFLAAVLSVRLCLRLVRDIFRKQTISHYLHNYVRFFERHSMLQIVLPLHFEGVSGNLINRLVSRQLRPVTVVVFVFSGKTQTNYGDFPIYWNHFDVALCRGVSSPLTLPQRETWQDKNLFFTLQPPAPAFR